MIGTTLGHYKLVAKLGHGGMVEVFRAQDLKKVPVTVFPSWATAVWERSSAPRI